MATPLWKQRKTRNSGLENVIDFSQVLPALTSVFPTFTPARNAGLRLQTSPTKRKLMSLSADGMHFYRLVQSPTPSLLQRPCSGFRPPQPLFRARSTPHLITSGKGGAQPASWVSLSRQPPTRHQGKKELPTRLNSHSPQGWRPRESQTPGLEGLRMPDREHPRRGAGWARLQSGKDRLQQGPALTNLLDRSCVSRRRRCCRCRQGRA